MTNAPAITGSISTGTLRTEDLIPACYYLLRSLGGRLSEGSAETYERFEDGTLHDATREDALDFLLEDLFDGINAVLPEGWYFGSVEGDGADFGIWEVEAH